MLGFLLLLLLLTAPAGVPACSSFIYKCEQTGNVPVSAHNFDNKVDARLSLVTLPAGYLFQASPPCSGCPAQNFTFQHGMAYLAATGAGYFGAVVQGMNSAGLAVGALTEARHSGPALTYRPDGPGTALTWPELMAFMLGSFGSVDEVEEYLTPQDIQVVADLSGSPQLELGVKQMFGITGSIPVHIAMYDASGEGGLLEFDDELGWVIYRNVTVATNMPTYPEHQANLQRWLAAQRNTTKQVSQLLQGGFEEAFSQLPGSYGPASRFVRLAMLLDEVCKYAPTPFPSDPNWSPAFAGVPAAPGREALAHAASVLQSVETGRGATLDLIGWTQVASLRDHLHGMLYWKTPLTARWQGINVTAAAAADGPMILPLWQGWQQAFEDVTPQMKPLAPVQPGPVGRGALQELQAFLNGTNVQAASGSSSDGGP